MLFSIRQKLKNVSLQHIAKISTADAINKQTRKGCLFHILIVTLLKLYSGILLLFVEKHDAKQPGVIKESSFFHKNCSILLLLY